MCWFIRQSFFTYFAFAIHMPPATTNLTPPFTILLVEDDMDDIMLLKAALQDNQVVCTVDVITEGDKVNGYLNGAKALPHIIVLDFNLPKKHGKEILREIKSDSRFSSIPVVVLTTSSSKEDMEYSYQHGANHFITKPTSVSGFNNAVNILCGLVLSTEKNSYKS
jgi:CheY-like chemotaxis protein